MKWFHESDDMDYSRPSGRTVREPGQHEAPAQTISSRTAEAHLRRRLVDGIECPERASGRSCIFCDHTPSRRHAWDPR